VYDKLLNPGQSFLITLYILRPIQITFFKVYFHEVDSVSRTAEVVGL
jgi:hypothetical protein